MKIATNIMIVVVLLFMGTQLQLGITMLHEDMNKKLPTFKVGDCLVPTGKDPWGVQDIYKIVKIGKFSYKTSLCGMYACYHPNAGDALYFTNQNDYYVVDCPVYN